MLQGVRLVVSAAKFDFDLLPAAVRLYLQRRGVNISELENNSLPRVQNNDRFTRKVDYVVKVGGEILPQTIEAILQGDDNKIRQLTLEMGSETAALANDERLSGVIGSGPHLAKALESLKKIQELEKVRDELEKLQILNDRDKSYISWTLRGMQYDLISSVVLVVEDVSKVAGYGEKKWLAKLDNYHKVADSLKSAIYNANDTFFTPIDLRTEYRSLLIRADKNQIINSGLSLFIDSAAEEVGKYLVRARTDVVTRRPDGTIAVSTDGVLYPH